MGFEKLTKEEMMNYLKLIAYVNGESAGFDRETIDNAMDKMVKLKVRPKKGSYAVKAVVQFDVNLLELYSIRQNIEELEKLIDENE